MLLGSTDDSHKPRPSRPHEGSGSSGSSQPSLDRDYRDKREAERIARHASSKPATSNSVNKQAIPHGHHRPPVDPKLKQHNRPPSSGYVPATSRPDLHRDLLREATRDIGLKDYREQSRDLTDSNRDAKISGNSNISSRDLQIRNSEKELQQQKRDSMLKPNVSSDSSSYLDRVSGDKQRGDMQRLSNSNRSSIDPNKLSSQQQQHIKHESSSDRHHDDSKQQPHVNEIKKHLSSASASSFLSKSMNTTSRKMESPFTISTDTSKSVPKMNSSSSSINVKSEPVKIKVDMKEQPVSPQQLVVKKPSLFSPEKSPPVRQKTPPLKHVMDIPTTPSTSHVPTTISPFNSPSDDTVEKRNRTVSSSSEPELRPVMKKIDQVEGFENLLRDPSIGIKVNHQVPDIITPIADSKSDKLTTNQLKDICKEMKPPDLISPFANPVSGQQPSQPIVNGIETNPTLISNLLKESHTVSHLPTIASPIEKAEVREHKEKDHHKERKKKNKEKHKHKDKDRSKEDKEKKKKHKDKDREKHKEKNKEREKQLEVIPMAQPIKITISKDKIQPPDPGIIGAGLKIKIPKDRLKPDTISSEPPPTAPLKIKIPKDVINNYTGESKKRERDKTSPRDGPPTKLSKSGHNRSSDSKQNGRSSYNKVSPYSSSNNNNISNSNKMRRSQLLRKQQPRQQFDNSKVSSNVACMPQPPPAMQPNFYYPPPYNMQPPMHHNMTVPLPQFMYQDPQMYLYGNGGYSMYSGLYPPPPPPTVSGAPPLPQDAPPDVPPPPPPE